MTDYAVQHDQPILGPACQNCGLLRYGCPVRAEGIAVDLRSWCNNWQVRKYGPKGVVMESLLPIPK